MPLYRIEDIVVTSELADGHNDGVVRSRWGVDGTGRLVLVEDFDATREHVGARRQFLEEIELRARVEPTLRAFQRGGLPLTIRPAHPGVRLDRFLEASAEERGRPPQELCLAVARALVGVARAEEREIPRSTLVWLGFDGGVTGLPTLVPRYRGWSKDYDLEKNSGPDEFHSVGVNLCRLVFGHYDATATSSEKVLKARSLGNDFVASFALTSTVQDSPEWRDLFAGNALRIAKHYANLPGRHPEITRVLAGLFPNEHIAAQVLVEEVEILNHEVPALQGVAALEPRYATELRVLADGPAGFP